MSCKLIQVIECDEARRGAGLRQTDPMRVVRQYWSTEGHLLAEVDPCALDDDKVKAAGFALCGVLRAGHVLGGGVEEHVKHLESLLNGGVDP